MKSYIKKIVISIIAQVIVEILILFVKSLLG